MSGVRGGLVRWGVLAALTLALCAGCGAGTRTGTPHPSPPPTSATPSASAHPAPSTAPPPAQCRAWGCRPRQTVSLAGGDTVTLWYGDDEQNYASRPVLELAGPSGALQWWVSPKGDGWNGQLTCLAGGAMPNCVLTDSLGMHAGVAELVVLQDGRLSHPPGGEVISNSGGTKAADLNGDGMLDVIGVVNDYKPNFAEGHSYWQTFDYAAGRYVSTGCAPKTASPPTVLLTGICPTPPR